MKRWHYFNAGQVERKTGSKVVRFQWQAGYSRVTESGTEYPWITRREAHRSAKENGARAVFHATEAQARKALNG